MRKKGSKLFKENNRQTDMDRNPGCRSDYSDDGSGMFCRKTEYEGESRASSV